MLLDITTALAAAIGVALMGVGMLRLRRRRSIARRVLAMGGDQWSTAVAPSQSVHFSARLLAGHIGTRVAGRFPDQADTLAVRMDRAGLPVGEAATAELLGWKVVCALVGGLIGLCATAEWGAGGLVPLGLGPVVGWFAVDILLARMNSQRRRSILRDLPTTMDLLVLSLEAGMGLDRAMRTIAAEYHNALSDEIRHVLRDVDLGLVRGEAFDRMALRVGLDDLRSLSRAIVQSEELGVSLVTVMHTQSHEMRISRRRAAEAEALRAPVKMLVPLVIFILPTLFMLLLGPVGLRAANSLSGIR